MTKVTGGSSAFEIFRSPREAFISWVRQRQAADDLYRQPDRLLDDIGIGRSEIRDAMRRGRR